MGIRGSQELFKYLVQKSLSWKSHGWEALLCVLQNEERKQMNLVFF